MNIGFGEESDSGLSGGQGRAVMVLGGGDESSVGRVEDSESIEFAIHLLGERHSYQISVSGEEARLSDIVPLARQLSTRFALLMLERLALEEQVVPCRKGCSDCCSYVIPLSIPEVFRFREEVIGMADETGRAVLERCLDVSQRIIGESPGERCGGGGASEGSPEASEVVEWYGGLDVACPLLSEGLCAHYDERPTVCREHIVTGSASACRSNRPDYSSDGEPHIASVPVSVVQVLGRLAAELEGGDVEAVMLPLALPWAEDNLERARRRWPARVMVERFVDILQEMASVSDIGCRM